MHTTPSRPPGGAFGEPGSSARWMRCANALAASTVSLVLLSSIVLMFDSAGPRTSPAPTQEVLESSAPCKGHEQRALRGACVRQPVVDEFT